MKKLFNVAINTVLVLLILLGALVAFSALPISGGLKMFSVQSGSMEPTIKTGSLIFVKSQESYEIGNIVTRATRDPEVTVTHRIVEFVEVDGQTGIKTKGDANDTEDSEIFKVDSLIGKVVFWIPFLGFPVSYAKTPQGLILVIVIPAVIIIYDEMQKIKKEIKKKVDYRKRAKKRQENAELEKTMKIKRVKDHVDTGVPGNENNKLKK